MINIVLGTDDNYVDHCAVTIFSILKHNTNVTIYLFIENLLLDNTDKLEKLALSNGGIIKFMKVDPEILHGFPMPTNASSHISIATYYRIFVEKLLPQDVHKVLYLDCDMVIRNDLTPLFELNMEEYAIAAVYQHNEWAIANNSFGRLGYSIDKGYFNAGTLLINLDYWRKQDVTNRLFNFIKKNKKNIISHDQDTLNAVLYNEVRTLDCTWNLLPLFLDKYLNDYTFPENVNYKECLINATTNPSIVHFVFKPKPWEYGCKNRYKDEYFKYLDILPWKTSKPSFNLHNYCVYIMKPRLVIIIKKAINLLFKNKYKV